jgi:uncharacterized protein (DUF58 family)
MRLVPPRAKAPLELDPGRVKALGDKVRAIESRVRGLVDAALAGTYLSAFRGRGIEFEDAPEEARAIDWKATARTGTPSIKQFREERELTQMLLVDVSASNDLASSAIAKRELAAELACVLALSATRNNDLVGLILFSDRIERYVAPRKGHAHALRIVREILGCKPEGRGTDIAGALRLAGSLAQRRSVMFLISDLEVGPRRAEAIEALRRAARPIGKRHDVIALHIRDPQEATLPDVGLLSVEDCETGEVISIDTGRRAIREKFARLALQRAAEVKVALRNTSVETVVVDTSQPYVPVLLELFSRREKGLP